MPRHSPLAWCRKTGAYITPLCPACLGAIETCRDEALLRRSGLPSFETSLIRFNYCRHCATETNRPPIFYTHSLQKVEGVAQAVQLRRRSELYRDLAPRLSSYDPSNAGSAVSPGGSSADSPEQLHPCFQCEHRAACYPAGRHVDDRIPAEELLFPLAYYDFYWIPLEPLPLSFHETVALMGGGELPGQPAGPGADPSASTLRQDLFDELNRPGDQFFFEGDTAGLFPLEALYIKLAALADLARGARDLLGTTGFAHLSLSPDRLRSSLSIGPSILPVRWGLSLKIGDLLTTAPPPELDAERSTEEPEIGCLPHPCPETFLPEGMSRPQIDNLWMRLTIEDLRVEETGGQRRAHLKARLAAEETYRGAEHGIHDLVRVILNIGSTEEHRVVFSGSKTGSIAGGFLFSGSTGPLSEIDFDTLKSSAPPPSSNIEVLIAHRFAGPADIISFGLLMLRMLLTNDQQDTTSLDARLAATLAESLAEISTTTGSSVDDPLGHAFRKEGISILPAEVLHRKIDRTAAQAAIPSELWKDALELALRMASNRPGWSICSAQDDYPVDDPTKPLRRVVDELEELMERARGSLIGSGGRNAGIQEVCSDFLADLREATSPAVAGLGDGSVEETVISMPEGGTE